MFENKKTYVVFLSMVLSMAWGLPSLAELPAPPLEPPTNPLAVTPSAIEENSIEENNKATIDDPAHHVEYNGICTWRTTCHSTRLNIKWPAAGSGCFVDAVPDLPIAVVLRGNGYDYRDYDYLQNHLRRNGMMTVSMDLVAHSPTVQSHQEVANRAEDVLTGGCFASFLDRFGTDEPVDFRRTAIIGHSRGGESARFLASNLSRIPGFRVRSVVALAPTRHTAQKLTGNQTDSYLLLYASSDTDVPPEQAFAAHDLAGNNEVSTPTSRDLTRSMKLLHGGSHAAFTDAGALSRSQRITTRGYVNAFLRFWLRDDFRFYGYISEDFIPGSFRNVTSQYSSGTFRRVIDSFERFSLNPSTVGGPVVNWGTAINQPTDATLLTDTAHAGRVFRVRPDFDGAFIGWGIPAGLRNARDFLYLSLRIGLLDEETPVGVRLWLQNGSDQSFVELEDFGDFPQPLHMCISGFSSFCFDSRDQGHMKTFRIPLRRLGPHNNVNAVYLQFHGGSVGKEFIVDNLEFTDPRFIFHP